ncbi:MULTISPECIES: hypothetical protein [unclassified Luteimonas]
MKYLVTTVALLLFTIPPVVSASDSGLIYASSDPSSEQLYVEMQGGVSLLIDKTTDRIYLNRPGEPEASLTFEEAIAGTSDIPQVRAANLVKLRSTLSDPDFLFTITAPRVAVDDSIWQLPEPDMCGDFICISPDSAKWHEADIEAGFNPGNGVGKRMCEHYLCPVLPMPCELGPCGVSSWESNLLFYSGWGAGWGGSEGGGSITQQELIAHDRHSFERSRLDACDRANLATASSALAGTGMVAACATSPSGVGLALCLAAGASFGLAMGELSSTSKQCKAEYPGLDNW